MINHGNVEQSYNRILYISMIFTLFSFVIAKEQYFIILPFLAVIISVGYFGNFQFIQKKHEWLLAYLLICLAVFTYVVSKGDALFAGGFLLLGVYASFFFRVEQDRRSFSNVIAVLGIMILATFLMDRFYYVFFFVPFALIFGRLLLCSYLYRCTAIETESIKTVKIPQNIQMNSLGIAENRLQRFTGKSILYFFIFACVVLVFIMIPRTEWTLEGPNLMRVGKVGFSQDMDSSAVSRLLQDPKVYFSVETESASYFKGAVYDSYLGTKWQSTFSKEYVRRNRQYEIVVNRPIPENTKRDIFYIFNYEGKTIFYQGTPYFFAFRQKNTYKGVEGDEQGNYNTFSVLKPKSVYAVTYTPTKQEPHEEEYTQWVRENYLELPEISTRVVDLANKITEGISGEYFKTQKIVNYVMENNEYTLNMDTRNNEISDYFLFEAKRGYCVHFATSACVMLRSLGIPARLVTGFRAKTYDAQLREFVVSNEDAHAWVQAYFPDKGWVDFDPTPPQDDYLSGLELWNTLYYHAHRLWMQYVIGYSRFQQSKIYRKIFDVFKWLFLQPWFYLLLTLWIALRITGKLSPSKKDKLAKRLPKTLRNLYQKPKTPKDLAGQYYNDMLQNLETYGIRKSDGETPHEFATRVERFYTMVSPHVNHITHSFCNVRFGHRDLNESEQKALQERVKDIKNAFTKKNEKKTNKI